LIQARSPQFKVGPNLFY